MIVDPFYPAATPHFTDVDAPVVSRFRPSYPKLHIPIAESVYLIRLPFAA